MGCLVMLYGPLVWSLCCCLTAGAALHIAPSASLAHNVNAVAVSRIASPRMRTEGVCRASECQSALGTAVATTTTTTGTICVGGTNQREPVPPGPRLVVDRAREPGQQKSTPARREADHREQVQPLRRHVIPAMARAGETRSRGEM